jgi:hypothetical protein
MSEFNEFDLSRKEVELERGARGQFEIGSSTSGK